MRTQSVSVPVPDNGQGGGMVSAVVTTTATALFALMILYTFSAAFLADYSLYATLKGEVAARDHPLHMRILNNGGLRLGSSFLTLLLAVAGAIVANIELLKLLTKVCFKKTGEGTNEEEVA